MIDTNESEMAESIAKFERQVRDWPKNRWKFLLIGTASLLLGLYMILCSAPYLSPDESPPDKFQFNEKSEELSTEVWLIGEVARVMTYKEHQIHIFALAMIELVIGIMIAFSSCFLLIPLIMHWKDGGNEIRLARLVLAYHEELELIKGQCG